MRRALVLVAVVALAGCRGYHSTDGAKIVHFKLDGLEETLVEPAGRGRGRPLLVFLHGRGSPPDSNLTQPLFDTLRALGSRAPDVLLANGGDHSYFHDRRDRRWATQILRHAIPAALARAHADPHRIAIGGISMGGFGALDLARIAPHAFCAVGAHSAALWFRAGDTAPGAFDDAEDFHRNDLIRLAAERRLYPMPVWIDVGRDDPFAAADTALARELRAHGTKVVFHLHAGGHGGWARRMPAYLRWYAARC
jgi:S-formylglutathione hydrolase FrmB